MHSDHGTSSDVSDLSCSSHAGSKHPSYIARTVQSAMLLSMRKFVAEVIDNDAVQPKPICNAPSLCTTWLTIFLSYYLLSIVGSMVVKQDYQVPIYLFALLSSLSPLFDIPLWLFKGCRYLKHRLALMQLLLAHNAAQLAVSSRRGKYQWFMKVVWRRYVDSKG